MGVANIKLRAFIDQASQVSLMSRQAIQRLEIRWRATDISVSGIANAAAGKNVRLRPIQGGSL